MSSQCRYTEATRQSFQIRVGKHKQPSKIPQPLTTRFKQKGSGNKDVMYDGKRTRKQRPRIQSINLWAPGYTENYSITIIYDSVIRIWAIIFSRPSTSCRDGSCSSILCHSACLMDAHAVKLVESIAMSTRPIRIRIRIIQTNSCQLHLPSPRKLSVTCNKRLHFKYTANPGWRTKQRTSFSWCLWLNRWKLEPFLFHSSSVTKIIFLYGSIASNAREMRWDWSSLVCLGLIWETFRVKSRFAFIHNKMNGTSFDDKGFSSSHDPRTKAFWSHFIYVYLRYHLVSSLSPGRRHQVMRGKDRHSQCSYVVVGKILKLQHCANLHPLQCWSQSSVSDCFFFFFFWLNETFSLPPSSMLLR